MQENNIQAQIEKAYQLVKKTGITEDILLAEAFKFALHAGANHDSVMTDLSSKAPISSSTQAAQSGLMGISKALDISIDIVELFFDMTDGDLTLNLPPKVLPDATSAAMREIAIVLTVGRKHAGLGMSTPFDLIRSICDENGKLDGKNFAAAMNLMKPKLVPSGKGTSKELVPKRPADDLAKELVLKYNEIAG